VPGFHDLQNALRKLEINPASPVIVHTSLSAFGQIRGGSPALLGALLGVFHAVVMPTFTYKTMLIPEAGPENNAILYGSGGDSNRMAEFFRPDLPSDRLMGVLPETLRRHPQARRSQHPILSFAGLNVDPILHSQTLEQPLEPIRLLLEAGGWVLLLGVNHTVNTSIHYAERLAGRRQFLRWALTPQGVCECRGFPGCSDGFEALAPHLETVVRKVQVSAALIQALPLPGLVEAAVACLAEDPLALLCSRSYCERCTTLRSVIRQL
jgi:aminoglycoside 3-N-acetyltransferase